jgi:hypothetical protein
MQSRYSLFLIAFVLLGSLTFDAAGQADRRASSRQSTRSDDANTVESFGAAGDLLFKRDGAMSAASPILTSASGTFSGSDVGKTVVVNGAGAAGVPLVSRIVSRQSARQVTLAASAATQVSGTIFYYGTDDTAAFQRAINETVAASGGVILLGKKNYLISSALSFPARHIGQEQVAVVEFRGAIGPVRSNWNNVDQKLGGPNDVKLPIAGQTIVQTASLSGKIIDFDWQTPISQAPSGVQVAFQNIVFRVPAQSSTTGLDLQHAYSCRIIDVTVEPSDNQSNLPPPVSGGIGIRLPRVGNGAQVVLDRVGVAGFDTGIRFSEHTDLRDVWIYRCRYGLIAEQSNHASQWGRVTIHWCPYGLVSEANVSAPPAFVTDGGLFDIEDAPNGHWAQTVANIHDPGNNLRGSIVYHRAVPFVGKESGIAVNGARHLLRREYGSRDYDADPSVISLPFSDNFNRTDFANISPDKKWSLTSGTVAIIKNNSASFSAGNAEAIAWIGSNMTEYEVRADITLSPARAAAGLAVKYESVGTYMAAILEIQSGHNRVRLFKRENGAYVDLATAPVPGMTLGGEYTLAVRYDAGAVKVFVEGAEKINHVLTPPEIQRFGPLNQFGLYAYMSTAAEDGGSSWDDLSAVPF